MSEYLLTPGWLRAAAGANLLSADGSAGVTIFEEITTAALCHGAINLGQGFPDQDGPIEILSAAAKNIEVGPNQYAPGRGIAPLREGIAAHQQRFYGYTVDPEEEVIVTTGATEAIAAAILSLCGPGDEVLTLEPFYDSYGAMINLAGATHTTVPLRYAKGSSETDGDWLVDPAELAAGFSDRTKMVIINSPHNPTGAVLDVEILNLIIRLAERFNAVILSDEVYEHLTFDRKHVPIASLPGGFERTISVSSAGKTFSLTGWKVGWASGPRELITPLRTIKQFLSYSSGGVFQGAIASALAYPDEFFAGLARSLKDRAEILTAGLESMGLPVRRAESGYFLIADAAALGENNAVRLARALPETVGVAAIPVGVFTSEKHREEYSTLLRFAFCKKPEVLEEAIDRLHEWGKSLGTVGS